jgi:oxysterol-binding protein-related protein 3/6/7
VFQVPAATSGRHGFNIKQDLSQVAMPVTFNEPLTMLQRAAEELEYFDILAQAARTQDPVERLCLVSAFAVSGYACTKNRSGRKSL